MACRSRFVLLTASFLATGIFAGCGGSQAPSSGPGLQSPAATGGSASFRLRWPEQSRLIPDSANSIRVEIRRGGTSIATRVLTRPVVGGVSSVTFSPLPVGDLTASASAYPTTDGTGTAQTQGTVPLTIESGKDTTFTLTMESAIHHLDVTPANPLLAAGETVQLIATARDAANNIVLMSPGKLTWASSNNGVAVLTASGLATASGAGIATVTATDTESGKTGQTRISVPLARWETGKDFSIVSNPNGAWSYGYSDTLNSPLILFTLSGSGDVRQFWSSPVDPLWFMAASRTPPDVTLNNGVVPPTIIPPNTFWLHPGVSGQFTHARWTAPADGSYTLQATFTGYSSTTSSVYIRVNDKLQFSANINGYLFTRSYTTPTALRLSQGDTVSFIVGTGGNGWDFDSTGVNATITWLP
jgi:hypothetical protein